MATETLINVGIRRNFVTLGDRNFEDGGTVQYAANYQPLSFNGTLYNVGDNLPFDANGNTTYSTAAIGQLRQFWDAGWITPLT